MEMEVWEWWDGRLKQGCNPPLWGNAGPRLGVGKDRVGRREVMLFWG